MLNGICDNLMGLKSITFNVMYANVYSCINKFNISWNEMCDSMYNSNGPNLIIELEIMKTIETNCPMYGGWIS